MRNPADWKYTNIPALQITDRGYTGHEHLTAFNLINMNGRFYDPTLGRMLSPDNYVQEPGYTQSYNRYAYCMNNPLKFTDPSGDYWQIIAGIIGGGAIGYLVGQANNAKGWEMAGYVAGGALLGWTIGAGIKSMQSYDGTQNVHPWNLGYEKTGSSLSRAFYKTVAFMTGGQYRNSSILWNFASNGDFYHGIPNLIAENFIGWDAKDELGNFLFMKGYSCFQFTQLQIKTLTNGKVKLKDDNGISFYNANSNKYNYHGTLLGSHYLINQLKKGNPVGVSVDYDPLNKSNTDGADHWVTIVGYGVQNGNPYFHFWDNALTSRDINIAISQSNKLIFDASTNSFRMTSGELLKKRDAVAYILTRLKINY